MSNSKKRNYNSETRESKALETKQRILDAARNLFSKEGFAGVTIDKIAQSAKVSTPTVYSIFQSKKGLLLALIDQALPPQLYNSLIEAAKNAKTARKLLKQCAHIARRLYDAERAQMEIFRGASVLAPEFKELENEREMRRYSRQEWVILTMEKDRSLAPGLTQTLARDILWMYTGRDIFRMLVVERGWSLDEYEKWLAETLIMSLVDPYQD